MSEQTWKLVPVEPTEEMQSAFFDGIDTHFNGRHDDVTPASAISAWKAMLAAAPAVEQQPVAWRWDQIMNEGDCQTGFTEHGEPQPSMTVRNVTPLYSHSNPADQRLVEENERLRTAIAKAKSDMWPCPNDGGFDREMGPIGCALGDKCVCIGVYPTLASALTTLEKLK